MIMLFLKKKKVKAPKDDYKMVVAKDGSGDFTTIQDPIYASKAFPYQRVIINIKNGIYNEKVHVYSWNTKISLIGESKENTIISFDDYFNKIDLGRNSTFHTSTLLVEGNEFIAKNLTIQNSLNTLFLVHMSQIIRNSLFFFFFLDIFVTQSIYNDLF